MQRSFSMLLLFLLLFTGCEDKKKPIIKVSSDKIVLKVGEKFENPLVEVKDNKDKKIKAKMEIINEKGEKVKKIDTSTKGKYKIIYTAKDISGNKANPVIVLVVIKNNRHTNVVIIMIIMISIIGFYRYSLKNKEKKIKEIDKLKSNKIIIDTNIWMNFSEKYDEMIDFFNCNNIQVIIPKEVYFEIDKYSFKKEGRIGKKRIDLLGKNIEICDLSIKNLYIKNNQKNIYADPILIRLVLSFDRNEDVIMVTDDRGLKITGRQVMKKNNFNQVNFFSGKEFLKIIEI